MHQKAPIEELNQMVRKMDQEQYNGVEVGAELIIKYLQDCTLFELCSSIFLSPKIKNCFLI